MPAAAENADLTPREVAELAGVPRRMVEKAIEEKVLTVRTGPVTAARHRKPDALRRLLGPESVAYLALVKNLARSVTLTAAGKKHLAGLLKTHRLSDMKNLRLEIAPAVTADLGRLAGEALERTDRYLRARDAWITSVAGIKGGLPVIKGTRITVHSVEARVRHGDSLDDIAAENPDIPLEAFEAALLFAKAHPLPGRPSGLPERHAS